MQVKNNVGEGGPGCRLKASGGWQRKHRSQQAWLCVYNLYNKSILQCLFPAPQQLSLKHTQLPSGQRQAERGEMRENAWRTAFGITSVNIVLLQPQSPGLPTAATAQILLSGIWASLKRTPAWTTQVRAKAISGRQWAPQPRQPGPVIPCSRACSSC